MATIAVCHSVLAAVWHMLSTGETYTDPGGDFFARRDPERTRKRLVGQLQRLGYTVTLQEGPRGSLSEIFFYRSSGRADAWTSLVGGSESTLATRRALALPFATSGALPLPLRQRDLGQAAGVGRVLAQRARASGGVARVSQRSSRRRSIWRLAQLAVAIEPDVAARRAADTLRTPTGAAVPAGPPCSPACEIHSLDRRHEVRRRAGHPSRGAGGRATRAKR